MKLFSKFMLGLVTMLALTHVDAAYSVLAEHYKGEDFFNKFNFYTGTDPTKGFVQYVDRATAHAKELIRADGTNVYLGVNFKDVQPQGRQSVRLESQRTFTRGLFLLDVAHMPGGTCGTWPAFWTLGSGEWPYNGEIDIVEGVHRNNYNHIALHTAEGCHADFAVQTGETLTSNCFIHAPGQDPNAGCGTRDHRPESFGHGFNANGGGVYAMEWNSDHIKVWFFPRGQIPADVMGPNPEPASWGHPAATFTGKCDINKYFKEHRIIINTTFCGDWAGAVFPHSGCGTQTCQEYVANNPEAFADAYWVINSLRVFSS